MRERVALLDGELETGRREGGGYRVAARLTIGDAR
jgi:signal transduction histidine kinase